jgi:hypothetical protein
LKIIRSALKYWLPLAAGITILSALIYVSIQQVLRIGANDPQIQMAEDTAMTLASGNALESVALTGKVDIAASVAPYMIVFDGSGKPLSSNGFLHGQIPPIPVGVFDEARRTGEDRVTLQPETGVRSAAVIVPIGDGSKGYVLAARSLREVEKRIDQLGLLVLTGWVAALFVSLFLVSILEVIPFTRNQKI